MALRTRLTAGVPLSGWVPWRLLREFLGPDHLIGEGPRKVHQLFGCLDMCPFARSPVSCNRCQAWLAYRSSVRLFEVRWTAML